LAEQHGLVGEGIVRNCSFVKTHWPERLGNQQFEAQRLILLVRNPFDAIDSYWNMNATKSHTKSVTDAVYTQYKDKWEGLAKNEIRVWLRFYEFWMQASVPVLIVRFEDLVENAAQELHRILQFTLDRRDITGFWAKRISYVTGDPIDKLGSYKPRTTTNRAAAFKSLQKKHYSDDLLASMRNAVSSFGSINYLLLFGYNGESVSPLNHDVLKTSRNQAVNDNFITINDSSFLIRPRTCPFGRALQTWRHSITNNDENPLPTVEQ
jgi:hypothetical protein